MEHFVDENVVMHFYLEQLNDDKIHFLQGNAAGKRQIAEMIAQLLSAHKMHNRIIVAKKLWKVLFAAAMSSLDPDRQGYDKLFAYFDEYVEFEELIFASDAFYRDHTLHCIWVYFLGEYVARKAEFSGLFEASRVNSRLFHTMWELLTDPALESAQTRKVVKACTAFDQIEKNTDAIRCISALTHDLGYPLKKIGKINKSIRGILPYFSVESSSDFQFAYGNTSQYFIDAFLRILSTTINPFISTNTPKAEQLLYRLFCIEESVAKSVRDEQIRQFTTEEKHLLAQDIQVVYRAMRNISDEMSACNDLEAYQHGIMSAFLLVKNIRAFQNLELEFASSMELSPENLADYWGKTSILRAISLHTCDSFRMQNIGNDSYLSFIDELEEFSRISRASQSREYVEEFCTSEIYMENNWFCVDFTFQNDNLESLDPGKAFRGKCKRFLSLFDIARLDPNLKIRLRCIGAIERDRSIYQLELARKHAKILIDGVEQEIPVYLKSSQFYTSDAYARI